MEIIPCRNQPSGRGQISAVRTFPGLLVHPAWSPQFENRQGKIKRDGQSESARRDLHIPAKKNFSTIFDLTTRTVPIKSTPQLGRNAAHNGASSAIRRPPRSLWARRRRRNFRLRTAARTARRPSARRCSRAPASSARQPPRRRAAPRERGDESRTTGGRVSTTGGSKRRDEEAAGGQQTHATDGKKYVDELGRGW